MAITDWRSWTAQQGTLGTPFPGQGSIVDFELITNNSSTVTTPALAPALGLPSWPYLPATVVGVDPFGGWNVQQETRTGVGRPYIAGLD